MADEIIPRHIGIIMDGNGRWAQKRGLPRSAGHAKGAEVFKTIVRHCEKRGVKAVTVFAFSTENWKRPASEVDSIMNLLHKYLEDVFTYLGETIKINFIGDRTRLSEDINALIDRLELTSRDHQGMILNIAVNYGGRQEIAFAAKRIAQDCVAGKLATDDIDETLFADYTDTARQPEVDMILRPSGEERISNFLLWQCAYSEFIYMDTLWPDFTPELMDKAIEEYAHRKRRFGGV